MINRIVVGCLMLFLTWTAYALELNSASASQLMSLKGIGEKTAQAILQERQRAGAFISLEDFSIRVKGIGKKRLDNLIKQGLHISPTSVTQEATTNHMRQSKEVREHVGAANGLSRSITEQAVHFILPTNNQEATKHLNSGRIKNQRQKAGVGSADIAEPTLVKPPK